MCLANTHADRAKNILQEDLQLSGCLAQSTLLDRFLIHSPLYYQNPYRTDPLSFAQMQHPRAAQYSPSFCNEKQARDRCLGFYSKGFFHSLMNRLANRLCFVFNNTTYRVLLLHRRTGSIRVVLLQVSSLYTIRCCGATPDRVYCLPMFSCLTARIYIVSRFLRPGLWL